MSKHVIEPTARESTVTTVPPFPRPPYAVKAGDAVKRPPIRGRESELRVIAQRVSLLCQGQGGCLLIDGPSGSGKTRLLAELAEMARDGNLLVASAACDELDRYAPMLPLLSALRASPEPIVALGELDSAATDADRRFWFLERLRDTLEQHARRAPLVVMLDDLQWADTATLVALRALCMSTPAVLWAFAHNPDLASADLGRVLDQLLARGAGQLSLMPLDLDDALELATDVLGRTPSAKIRALVDDAHGNPFLITELLHLAQEEKNLGEPDAPALCAGVPGRFRHHIRRRLREVSPDVRQLLEVGAILGRSFALDDAARMLVRPAGLMLDTVATALGTGLIVTERESLVFRHDLIHRAIYDELPEAVRVGLHREAARLMRGAGRSAGEAAAQYASESLRLARSENAGPPTASAMTLTSQIAFYRGHVAEALSTAQAAVHVLAADPATSDRLPRLWLARVLLAGDQPGDSSELCLEGERVATGIDADWSRAYWSLCRACRQLECGQLASAARDAESSHRTAAELGLAHPASAALGVLGQVAFHQGDLAAAENYARAAGLAADGLAPHPAARWVRVLLADAEGRPDSALDIALDDGSGTDQDRLAMLLEIGVTAIPYAARIALRAARTAECQRLIAHAQGLAEANPGMTIAAGIAAHAQGIARRDPDSLGRAVTAYRETGRALAAVMAGEDLGRALLHAGDHTAAIAHLRGALTMAAEIGAIRHADRIRRVLREAGVRHRFNSPRRSAAFGWGSLTAAELRVASLAAEGLTNQAIAERLFLSPHTINTHLRHIFNKLGVNGRLGLIRFMLTEMPQAVAN